MPVPFHASLLTTEGERVLRDGGPPPIDPSTGHPAVPAPQLEPFHVPAGLAAALRLEFNGRVTVTPLPAVEPGAEAAVTVRWPEPAQVRVRVVGPDGAVPSELLVALRTDDGGEARSRAGDGEGVVTIPTWGSGTAVLKVFTRGETYYADERRICSVPAEPGAVLDLGTITLPEREPRRTPPDRAAGRTATLRVTIATSDGARPGAIGVTVDGSTHWVKSGTEALKSIAVAPGPHELVVAAPGYLARVQRIVLAGDEVRGVTVRLQRRR
ncbi:MAG: hypothetical protein ACYTGX_17025 [Planctomycetota bacterium]